MVVGIGKSGNIGQKIAATFNSTGATSVLLDPVNALHGDIGLLMTAMWCWHSRRPGNPDELVNYWACLKISPNHRPDWLAQPLWTLQ